MLCKRLSIHCSSRSEAPSSASAKLSAEPVFPEHLEAILGKTCDRSLVRNFDQIGVNSAVDLVETYL